MNPAAFAETMNDATVFWLKKKAWELNAAVTGSFICIDNDNYYNRLVWMLPDGSLSTYDKRHRFTLAGEDKYYAEGVERLVVEWRGWRICRYRCFRSAGDGGDACDWAACHARRACRSR